MCTYVYTHIYTNGASGTDRSSGSSGPVGVWRATSLSEKHTGCCGLGLGCGSQTLLQILSVSLCCPPWLREAGPQSRFLCVFLHWRRQRLPTHISTAAPEGSWLSFHYCKPNRFSFLFLGGGVCFGCACVCMIGEQAVIKGDKWSMAFINLTAAYFLRKCRAVIMISISYKFIGKAISLYIVH